MIERETLHATSLHFGWPFVTVMIVDANQRATEGEDLAEGRQYTHVDLPRWRHPKGGEDQLRPEEDQGGGEP